MRSSAKLALLGRELKIALRARVTWLVTALASLLVGHGFVLAIELYASASRSVASGALMQREMDPLAGIVRPTLGGAELAVTLFVPIVAARLLGIEKERRSFGALCLAVGSPTRVVTAKLEAAAVLALLIASPSVVLFTTFALLGGHLDPIETAIATTAHLLHATLIALVAIAAAAWTRTLAQATTVAVVVSIASWVFDAGEGFAALAWLEPLASMSVTRVLAPLQEGIVSVHSLAWLAVAMATATGLALIGGRIDVPLGRRRAWGILLVAGMSVLLVIGSRQSLVYDWTEYRRASYPPAVVDALRSIREPIVLEVWLDRDDSRRRHLEHDALAKLRLARANIAIRMPLDERDAVEMGTRNEDYGRVVVRVGDQSSETRSTSRSEIVTRIFALAGHETPSFAQAAYPGYPAPWSAARLRVVRFVAYGGMPCMVLIVGALVTRRRRSKKS